MQLPISCVAHLGVTGTSDVTDAADTATVAPNITISTATSSTQTLWLDRIQLDVVRRRPRWTSLGVVVVVVPLSAGFRRYLTVNEDDDELQLLCDGNGMTNICTTCVCVLDLEMESLLWLEWLRQTFACRASRRRICVMVVGALRLYIYVNLLWFDLVMTALGQTVLILVVFTSLVAVPQYKFPFVRLLCCYCCGEPRIEFCTDDNPNCI